MIKIKESLARRLRLLANRLYFVPACATEEEIEIPRLTISNYIPVPISVKTVLPSHLIEKIDDRMIEDLKRSCINSLAEKIAPFVEFTKGYSPTTGEFVVEGKFMFFRKDD